MKSLSIRTASLAIAMSLATAAQAQTEGVDKAEVPTIDSEQQLGFLNDGDTRLVNEEFDLAASGALVSVDVPVASVSDFAAGDEVVTMRSLDPRYGDIDAFWGDIIAFYGNIDAFWGDINPFYGDIGAFWGDISPFYGDITAFWGDIDAFWGDIIAFDAAHLASLGNFWQAASTQISATDHVWSKLIYEKAGSGYEIEYNGTPDLILAELEKLISQAEAQFGAAYTAETEQSFREGLVSEFLARHGINLSDKTSLAGFSAADRAAFFLDWHDSLMAYSGIDQVDHWMGTVNWTPSLTQIQGEKAITMIGIIDSNFGDDPEFSDNLILNEGNIDDLNGHGAGVASLILAEHDGEGIMGIAPNAIVAAYNPFDAQGNASWANIAAGINAIKAVAKTDDGGRASLINLSLGEPGFVATQGLSDVFRQKDIAAYNGQTVYVIAAGNEGIAQNHNIEWGFSSGASKSDVVLLDSSGNLLDPVYSGVSDTAAIFVGSVRPDGTISSFSNTPGSACLLDNGVCHERNRLMNFFVVAPGELLLVNDGQGGLVRRSGTSFAAPLVSGAIALLHDRWPWLANKPQETTQIIFRSARDLGAPGVDPVYGHGLLDVTASQSPLDFGAMTFTLYRKSRKRYSSTSMSASQLLTGGIPSWWETEDVFFTGIENIGSTHRDFAIPMSSFTYGRTTNALGSGYQRFQDFVSDRFANWLLSKGTDKNGDGRLGVSQVRSNTAETSGLWTMRYDAIQPRLTEEGAIRPVHNSATLTNPKGNLSFTFGHGQGALALTGQNFGIVSDHDHETGGVNPVLGLASGEIFAQAAYKPAPNTTVSVGYSNNREDWKDLDGVSEAERSLQRHLGARDAEALTVSVGQKVTDRLSVNAQWTRLNEKDALLGTQTGIDALLGEGSATDAVTVSASFDAGNGLSFDLSATGSATKTAKGQLLASTGNVMSSAAQFAINKRGVVGERDILRVSIGQPLTVEDGELELRSDQVIDRMTGEIGPVSQFFGIETKRRYTAEVVYATPVTEASELGLIGRYVSAGDDGAEATVMLGANFGMRF